MKTLLLCISISFFHPQNSFARANSGAPIPAKLELTCSDPVQSRTALGPINVTVNNDQTVTAEIVFPLVYKLLSTDNGSRIYSSTIAGSRGLPSQTTLLKFNADYSRLEVVFDADQPTESVAFICKSGF